jgi:hypothetical protein
LTLCNSSLLLTQLVQLISILVPHHTSKLRFVVLLSSTYLFTVGVEDFIFTWSHSDTHHSR